MAEKEAKMISLTEKEMKYLTIESKTTNEVRISPGFMRWLNECYVQGVFMDPPAFPAEENRFRIDLEEFDKKHDSNSV